MHIAPRAVRPRRTATLILTAMAMLSPAASGDTLYVTDELRLGLHAASDTSDRPIRMLFSGTPLEVLERSQFYARVRTPDGLEGWTKASYLTEEKPAKARLFEFESRIETLEAELASARESLDAATQRTDTLATELRDARASARSSADELARTLSENEELRTRVDRYSASMPVTWAIILAVIVLVAGFGGGVGWIDRRSRKRHGGFRVY